jgi:long-chain acyl-CoA synthetase
MLTHRNFLSNVEASVQILKGGTEDRCLSFLPLSHVFERMAGFYFMLYQGVSIAYAENMNTVPQNILEIRPTMVASVPRLYEKIYARILEQVHGAGGLRKKIFEWSLALGRKTAPYRCEGKRMPPGLALQYKLARKLVYEKIKAKLGGRIRFFISGGAPLCKEIAEFFFAADLLILEGYGLTETSPVVSVNRPDDFKFGTVGKLLAQVEVRIASDGEILVRGPNIMRGYYKMEKETREAIVDGWFHTGDIGEFDSDGFLKITDRKKDLIITSGGKNIAPQKIENLLVADEYILQVCVCGDRKNYLTALVVPDFGPLAKYAREKGIPFVNCQDLVRREAVKTWLAERIEVRTRELANYEKIKQFTLLAEEFSQDRGELTPTLKIKRKMVTEKYRAAIEAMYDVKPPA